MFLPHLSLAVAALGCSNTEICKSFLNSTLTAQHGVLGLCFGNKLTPSKKCVHVDILQKSACVVEWAFRAPRKGCPKGLCSTGSSGMQVLKAGAAQAPHVSSVLGFSHIWKDWRHPSSLGKPRCDAVIGVFLLKYSPWTSLLCVCRASALGSNGKASEQGFRAEGEVQEPPRAGNIPGKFKVVGGQADRVCHHCRNTQGVRTEWSGDGAWGDQEGLGPFLGFWAFSSSPSFPLLISQPIL